MMTARFQRERGMIVRDAVTARGRTSHQKAISVSLVV
jgi:hypothetical protein